MGLSVILRVSGYTCTCTCIYTQCTCSKIMSVVLTIMCDNTLEL